MTLERSLYVQVDNVIQSMGGKWNSKARAHIFDVEANPCESGEWDEVIATGIMPDKNPQAFWPTPKPVVDEVVKLARTYAIEARPIQSILEPSAGEGDIVVPLKAAFPQSHFIAVELNDLRFAKLQKIADVAALHGDFLSMNLSLQFDFIAMNPPFAVPGDALAYVSHIKHAAKHLAPWGWLVAITPSSIEFRMDRRTANLRAFFERWGGIQRLPPGSFDVVGTAVGTCLCVAYAPSFWEWE